MCRLLTRKLRGYPNHLALVILRKYFRVKFWVNCAEIINLANLPKKDLISLFSIKHQLIFWYLTLSIFRKGEFGNRCVKQQINFTAKFKIFEDFRRLLSSNELLSELNYLLFKGNETIINNKNLVTIVKLSIDLNETSLIHHEFKKQISEKTFSVFDIWTTAIKSADVFHQEGLFNEAEQLLLNAKVACDLAGKRSPGIYNENTYLTAIGHIALFGVLIMGKKSGFLAKSKTSIVSNKKHINNTLLAEILVRKAKAQDIEILEINELNLMEPNMEVFHKSIESTKFEYVIARREYGNLFRQYNNLHSTPFLNVTDLTPSTIETAKEILSDYGISDTNNLIGIHCRENQPISRANRNSNFAKLSEPIDFMIKNGMSVVRLGNFKSNNESNIKMNFVDLTTLKLQQYEYEAVNLYVWAKSRLFLGNLSGGTFPPLLFGVPIVWFDVFPFRHFIPPGVNDKILPKKVYSVAEKKLLSMSELFSPKCINTQTENPITLSRRGFELIDTTGSEIVSCLKDIYADLESKKSSAYKASRQYSTNSNLENVFEFHSKLPKSFLKANEQYSA